MRDVPQGGGKMPSVTIMDIKKPTPGGPPKPDDAGAGENTFTCPHCGGKCSVETADEAATPGEEGSEMGGGGKY